MKVNSHIDRIMTPQDRLDHIEWCKANDRLSPWGASDDPQHYEMVGDLAAHSSNIEHDPKTGFHRFKDDAPEWVRKLSIKRGWMPDPVILTEAGHGQRSSV